MMKRFLTLPGLALVFTLFSFQSDVESMLMDLKFGNLDQVSNRFYDYVELRLPDQEINKTLNRMEAKNYLKTFFNKNRVKGFTKESDDSDGRTRIITGKLATNGDGYTMSIYMRQVNGKNFVLAIGIN